MTLDEIIAARVRKYTTDIARHNNTPSQPDRTCRCEGCYLSRRMLSELSYVQTAARNLKDHPAPALSAADGAKP